MSSRQTRFSDVCGTMDELKRLVHEEYERVVSDPDGRVTPLLEDALFMLERMKARLEAYAQFRQDIRDILSQMDQVDKIDDRKACEALACIGDDVRAAGSGQNVDIEQIDVLAENVRAVASAIEHQLRAYKGFVVKLCDLLIRIKGTRAWIISGEASESLESSLKRQHQAWLPPEPHCSMLLERLAASTAYVAEEQLPDGEPEVHFMDGGAMPMSQIRWDPDIQNFHPALFRPAATGRKYRRSSGDTA